MSSTQAPTTHSHPAGELSIDALFPGQGLREYTGSQVVRLSGSSAQLCFAAVLAVASILLFTLAFA
jgi:hypothetical protein